jgi:hypothetical protein
MKADASGFSLHEILLIVGVQLRTGELVLESGNNIGSMLFHEGKILQAFSPSSRAVRRALFIHGKIAAGILVSCSNFLPWPDRA